MALAVGRRRLERFRIEVEKWIVKETRQKNSWMA